MLIDRECIAFGIMVSLIILIIGMMPIQYYNQLATPFIRIGNFGLDWWHVSHLWFYMVLGARCPGNFWFYTALGSGFELFESMLGVVGLQIESDRAKNQLDEHYWFGRWEDVAVNGIGYLIGEWTSTGRLDLSL